MISRSRPVGLNLLADYLCTLGCRPIGVPRSLILNGTKLCHPKRAMAGRYRWWGVRSFDQGSRGSVLTYAKSAGDPSRPAGASLPVKRGRADHARATNRWAYLRPACPLNGGGRLIVYGAPQRILRTGKIADAHRVRPRSCHRCGGYRRSPVCSCSPLSNVARAPRAKLRLRR
jgi:hypothetical protein